LDGEVANRITAFLFNAGADSSPVRLSTNSGYVFSGCKIYGQGFLFADGDPAATPLSRMQELLVARPANSEIIRPYVGGEDITNSPTLDSARHVVSFGTRSERESEAWPELLDLVRTKVAAERRSAPAEVRALPPWQFFRPRPELYAALRALPRCIVNSQVASHLAFAFQPTNRVFSHALNVFAFNSYATFAALQSRPHDVWARFFGSSMKDDLRYTPSDCFETFPFPSGWETDPTLENAGEVYYEFRADLMIRNNEGLTATYNRFHDPNERSPDILRLRKLHDEMDRAVLDAYGWTDLRPTCEFLLDYEEEEDEEEQTSRRRRKPWRYRWPDEFRDEVVARLLELNRQRAIEEGQVLPDTVSPEPSKAASAKRAGRGRKASSPAPQLFDD
jgi:hypothetical protein